MKLYLHFCILVISLILNSCIFQTNTAPVLSKMQSKYQLLEIRFSGKIEDVSGNKEKKFIEIKTYTLNTLPSTYADSVFYFENDRKTEAYKIIRIIDEKNKNKYAWAILELSNKKYLKVEKGQYNDFTTSEMLDKYDTEMGKTRFFYTIAK